MKDNEINNEDGALKQWWQAMESANALEGRGMHFHVFLFLTQISVTD